MLIIYFFQFQQNTILTKGVYLQEPSITIPDIRIQGNNTVQATLYLTFLKLFNSRKTMKIVKTQCSYMLNTGLGSEQRDLYFFNY